MNEADLAAADDRDEPRPDNVSVLEQTIANLEQRCTGLTSEERAQVADLLREFPDRFRDSLTEEPIRTTVEVSAEVLPGAVPHRAYSRITDPAKRAFAQKFTREKLKLGIIRPAPGNLFVSSAFILVKKPGPNGEVRFREVANYQGLDQITVSIGTDGLDIRSIVSQLRGRRFKGVFDLHSAFTQVGVAERSQNLFGYLTVDGVFIPTRLVMGWKNSPAWLRLVLEEVFHELGVHIYVDDVLVSAATFPGYLAELRAFLTRCRERNVILGASKFPCSTEVPFLGLTLTETGWRKAVPNLGPLSEHAPVTAADLAARVGYLGWLRDNCAGLDMHLAPLHDVMARVHASTGKLTKASDAKVPLDERVGWTAEHVACLGRAWACVRDALELAFPDPDQVVNIISDASDVGCGYVITQVPPEDMALPVHERRHELLSIYTHRFVGSALNWTVAERELEPLHRALTRDRHLAEGRAVFAYVDHLNLIGLLHHPERLHLRASSARVIRRLLDLCGLNLEVAHIPGVLNAFADLLSRQFADYPLIRVRAFTDHFVGPSDGSGFALPARELLQQHSVPSDVAAEAAVFGAELGADGLFRVGAAIWVPPALRSAVIAAVHCGRGGHRSAAAALVHLNGYVWAGRDDQVALEIQQCIHCAQTRPGSVPRPFGTSVAGAAVGEVLVADYFSLPRDAEAFDHVLVVSDSASQFTWAFPTGTPDGPTTVRHLRALLLEHNLQPRVFACDGGPGFTGVLVTVLDELQIRHHPHVPRAPWTNGAAERRGQELLRALRPQLSEQRRPTHEWRAVLARAVFAVNSTPSVQLGGRTPFEVFTGRPSPALGALVASREQEFPGLTVAETGALADAARAAFLETERDVLAHRAEALERRQRRRAAQPNVRPVDFEEGDYVLVAVSGGIAGEQDKLAALWEGPFLVTKASQDQVAEVRRLGSALRQRVHVQRLAFFDGPGLTVTEELQRVADLSAPGTYIVDEIRGIVNRGREAFRFVVSWVGYADFSEEPVGKFYAQVPDVVDAYLARDDLPAASRTLVPRVRSVLQRSLATRAATEERKQQREVGRQGRR